MGADEMEQAQEDQGWNYGDGFVCAGCVDDDTLAGKIATDAARTKEHCTYCGHSPAAPLDTLLQAFFDGLHTEYSLAGSELAYFEGELVPVKRWDGDELVDTYADVLHGDELQEAVRKAARHDDVWVERHFIEPRHDEALLDGWNRFSHEVMYRTRHVFWLAPPHQDEAYLGGGEIPAAAILDTLGALIPQACLIHEIPAGHLLWRARTHDGEQHWSARDLGTASPTQARQPNRMSPAGIPLFYGADNPTTAIQEVARHATTQLVTYAAFETTRPCRVVDFTRLGPIPAIFDTDRAPLRRALMFLHEFVSRLSADADGHEHLTYVPTQIVTEYLLRVFDRERPVGGLVYTSAAGREGRCTVLDIPQTRCLDPDGAEPDAHPALRLVPGTLHANQPLPRDLTPAEGNAPHRQ
ncbi:HEPN-associated N-terminal domain-containing protein [Streptomyces sp. AD681]|uniref:HEPN-associated N-terminal domain-containing protein n=1 Tax=Streptomyces sp. AD681 TaxID=3019069 RepID=UPI0022F1D273|nr:HEPN-associated N-terminal domain-containing protein [Streptomyces sp. AD681]MDA5147337.1 HEPN-associated N-terminal domain-containing protein [Streptomyces sp. AD681]